MNLSQTFFALLMMAQLSTLTYLIGSCTYYTSKITKKRELKEI